MSFICIEGCEEFSLFKELGNGKREKVKENEVGRCG